MQCSAVLFALQTLSFLPRFSVLEVENIDSELENELVSQYESPVTLPYNRTAKPCHTYRHDQKEFVTETPPFLRTPRELRWMVFDELVASNSEIEISPSTIDSFHALRLTTKGLREEVKGWAKKRPDVANDFPFGYYIPSKTTFVLKIDHRWTKRVKHKTVSGSHVTIKPSKNLNGDSSTEEGSYPTFSIISLFGLDIDIQIYIGPVETMGLDYLTRKQAWYGFCSTRKERSVARTNLKIEIFLSDKFAPKFLSHVDPQELFEALMAAKYYSGGKSWASMRLFVQGTNSQLLNLDGESMFLQIRDLLRVTQKTNFDQETWEQFRDNTWPDRNNYDALEYPIEAMYWEDERYKTFKKDKAGADIYEFGGLVMQCKIKSAEEMRGLPILPLEREDVLEEEPYELTMEFLQGGSCL